MTDTTMQSTAAAGARRAFGPDADWWAAARTPLVLGLAAALAVQLLLALLLGGGRGMAPAAGDVALLDLDPATVTRIGITGAEGETLVLTRDGDAWVLPDLDGFPASSTRVDGLLDDLAGLTRPLPVATSAEAQRRFKVADDAFERRLTLSGDGTDATLVIGDSPGFRRLFARVDGEDAVYDLRLALFDLSAEADDWIDRGHLQFDRGAITRIAADDWALVRGEEGWSLEGTEAAVDTAAADTLVDAVATVAYTGVLGPDSDADYDLDAPARVLTIDRDGEQRRYLLAPIGDTGDYALKRADEPYVYRIGAFEAETLVGTDRAKLLGEAPPAEATTPAGAASDEVTDESSPAAGPPEATGEAKPEPQPAPPAAPESEPEPESEPAASAPAPAMPAVEPAASAPARIDDVTAAGLDSH